MITTTTTTKKQNKTTYSRDGQKTFERYRIGKEMWVRHGNGEFWTLWIVTKAIKMVEIFDGKHDKT